MLRMAIIYEENEVFVEIKPEKFVELLEEYVKDRGGIREAIKAIEFDLKQKTMYK